MDRRYFESKPYIVALIMWCVFTPAALLLEVADANLTNDTIAFWCGSLRCILASLSAVLTVFLIKGALNKFSVAAMLIFPLVVCLPFWFFSNQVAYLIYDIYFFAMLIWFLVTAFLSYTFINDNKLGHALIPFLYAAALWFFKCFDLPIYVTTTEILETVDDMACAGGIAIVATVAAAAVYVVLQKDRSDKKEYGKRLVQLAALVFVCVSIVSVISAHNINYAFNTSAGVSESCQVLGKYVEHGPGIYSFNRYYVVVRYDQGQEKIQLPLNEYEEIIEGDTIVLTKHEAALGLTYFEYQP